MADEGTIGILKSDAGDTELTSFDIHAPPHVCILRLHTLSAASRHDAPNNIRDMPV